MPTSSSSATRRRERKKFGKQATSTRTSLFRENDGVREERAQQFLFFFRNDELGDFPKRELPMTPCTVNVKRGKKKWNWGQSKDNDVMHHREPGECALKLPHSQKHPISNPRSIRSSWSLSVFQLTRLFHFPVPAIKLTPRSLTSACVTASRSL